MGVIRLGGEGHQALFEALDEPPTDWQTLMATQPVGSDKATAVAYLLTPGLAKAEADKPIYGVYPHSWQSALQHFPV
jgi:hypothetical protein